METEKLKDRLSIKEKPMLTLEECLKIVRAVKPQNWKPNINNCRRYTTYDGKLDEAQLGDEIDYLSVSLTKWNYENVNYELSIELNSAEVGNHKEEEWEFGKIQKLFEDIVNYEENIQKNKDIQIARKFVNLKWQ